MRRLFAAFTLAVGWLGCQEVRAQATPEERRQAALAWLAGRQELEGGEWWTATPSQPLLRAQPSVEATAEALLALAGADGYETRSSRGLSWLSSRPAVSTGVAARTLEALAVHGVEQGAASARLLALRRASGAWGPRSGWEGELHDTLLGLQALIAAGQGPANVVQPAVVFVRSKRRDASPVPGTPRGGWGIDSWEHACPGGDGCARIRETAMAVRALAPLADAFGTGADVQAGVAWLLHEQNANGSFSDEGAGDVADTALAFLALVESGLDVGDAAVRAAEWLESVQAWNPGSPSHGSWGEDVVATALASRAMARHRVNLSVVLADFTADPVAPSVQDVVVSLRAVVRNLGTRTSAATEAQFRDGAPGAGAPIGAALAVGALDPGDFVEVEAQWETSAATGTRELTVEVDGNDANPDERSEDDNVARRLHEILTRPNLAVVDLHFDPPSPMVSERASAVFDLVNTGGTTLANVTATIRRTLPTPADPQALGPWSLEPGESRRVTVRIAHSSSDEYGYRVEAATSGVTEADETDNAAEATVIVADSVDLAVHSSGLRFDPVGSGDGAPVAVSIAAWNRGTTEQAGATVRFYEGNPATSPSIGNPVSLPTLVAGASASASVVWNTAGKVGDFAVTAVVTAAAGVTEPNTRNNTASRVVSLTDRPDVTVAADTPPCAPASPVSEGTLVTFHFVAVPGTVDELGSVRFDFYDGDPREGGVFFGSTTRSLSAGASEDVPSPAWSTLGQSGEHEIFCVADATGAFLETDEENNFASTTITVTPSSQPNVHVQALDVSVAPEEPVEGDVATLRVRLHEVGGVAVTSCTVELFDWTAAGEVPVGLPQVVSIPARGDVLVSAPWDTTGKRGLHRLRAVVSNVSPAQSLTTDDAAEKWVEVFLPPASCALSLEEPPLLTDRVELTWTATGPDCGSLAGVTVHRDGTCLNCASVVSRSPSTATATVSASLAGQAIDASCSTYWSAGAGASAANQSLTVSLPLPRRVDRVTLRWESVPDEFRLELLADAGATLVESLTVATLQAEDSDVSFPQGRVVDTVRVVVTDPGAQSRLAELEAWAIDGVSSAAPHVDWPAPNARYSYHVRGFMSDGHRTTASNTRLAGLGSDLEAPPAPTIPAPPANPAPGAPGDSANDRLLTWTSVSDPGLAGYRLYRTNLNVAAAGRGGVPFVAGGVSPADVTATQALLVPNLNDGVTVALNANQLARCYWARQVPVVLGVGFARTYTIDRAIVHLPSDGQRYRYLLQSSLDGSEWTTLADATATDFEGGAHEHAFAPLPARLVRVWPTRATGLHSAPSGLPSAHELRITELEVFSTDLAPVRLDSVTAHVIVHATTGATCTARATDAPSSPVADGLLSLRFPSIEVDARSGSVAARRDLPAPTADVARWSGTHLGVSSPWRRMTRGQVDYAGPATSHAAWRLGGYARLALEATTASSHSDVLLESGTYRYGVSAWDVEGNESALAVSQTETFLDQAPPRAPDVTCAVENGRPRISWGYSGSAPGDVAGFKVHRRLASGTDGDYEWVSGPALLAASVHDFLDLSAPNAVDLRWKVSAVDHAGNETEDAESNSHWCSSRPDGVDLAMTADDIFTFPARPSVGNAARLVALVTNRGDGQLVIDEGEDVPATNVAHGVVATFSVDGSVIGQAPVQDLPRSRSAFAVLEWTPGAAGARDVSVSVACSDAELSVANNEAGREIVVYEQPPLVMVPSVVRAEEFPDLHVDVAVADAAGEAAWYLETESFTAGEAGVPGRVELATPLNSPTSPHAPVDVLFLGDASGSMAEEWTLLWRIQPRVVELLETAGLDVSSQVYRMGDTCLQEAPQSAAAVPLEHGWLDGAEFRNDEDCGPPSGGQGVGFWDQWAPTVQWMAQSATTWRPGARRFLVVMSDNGPMGDVTSDGHRGIAHAVLEHCRAHEVTVITLVGNSGSGMGYNAAVSMLTDLAELTGGTSTPLVNAMSAAAVIQDGILGEWARYRLDVTTPDPTHDGTWRALDLTAERADQVANATVSYRAPWIDAPDLVVEGLTLAPGPHEAGDLVGIEAVIANRGGRAADGVAVELQDGDPAAGGFTEVELGLGHLAVGETRSVSLSWHAIAGGRELRVAADPLGAIAEAREDNNVATAAVDVTGAPTPELSVAARDVVLVPERPREGDAQQVRVRVVNRGSVDAHGVTLNLHDGDPEVEGTLVATDSIPFIAARGSATQTLHWTVAAPAGRRLLTAVVDPADAVAEANELDNRADAPLDVRGSGLVARLGWTAGSLDWDDSVDWSVTLENAGEAPLAGAARVEIVDENGAVASVVHEERLFLPAVLAPGRRHARRFDVTPAADVRDVNVAGEVDLPLMLDGSPFHAGSVLVVEVDEAGGRIAEHPSLFQPSAPGSPSGLVTWGVDGPWPGGVTRRFVVLHEGEHRAPFHLPARRLPELAGQPLFVTTELGDVLRVEAGPDGPTRVDHLGDPTPMVRSQGERDDELIALPADFDGDGHLDLFLGGRDWREALELSKDTRAPMAFIRWSGAEGPSGPRTDLITHRDARVVMYAAVADFDADGRPDLLLDYRSRGVVSGEPRVLEIWINQGGRAFARHDVSALRAGLEPSAGELRGVAAGDLDGDGDSDLAWVRKGASGSTAPWVHLARNDGGASFTNVATLAPGSEFGSCSLQGMHVAIGDVNGDGRGDVLAFVRCAAALPAHSRAWLGHGDFSFEPSLEVEPWPWTVASHYDSRIEVPSSTLLDLDSDGILDLLGAGAGPASEAVVEVPTVAWMRGRGDGTFDTARHLMARSVPLQSVAAVPRMTLRAAAALEVPAAPVPLERTGRWTPGSLQAGRYTARVRFVTEDGRVVSPEPSFHDLSLAPATATAAVLQDLDRSTVAGLVRLERQSLEEVAQGRQVSDVTGAPAANLVDGATGTPWQLLGRSGWAEVELGSTRHVDVVEVVNEYADGFSVTASRQHAWLTDEVGLAAGNFAAWCCPSSQAHVVRHEVGIPVAADRARLFLEGGKDDSPDIVSVRELRLFEATFDASGTLTLPAVDGLAAAAGAGLVAAESIRVDAGVPPGTRIALEGRAGDVADESTWASGWTAIASDRPLPASLRKRYLRVRAVMSTDEEHATPGLRDLVVAWRDAGEHAFDVVSDAALSAEIATARRSYRAHESVAIPVTVTSLAHSVTLEGLRLAVTIRDATGVVRGTAEPAAGLELAALSPGSVRTRTFTWNSAATPPGTYRAHLVVSAGGSVLAETDSALFDVVDEPLETLVGTLQVSPVIVVGPPNPTVTWSVTNGGNRNLDVVQVRILSRLASSGAADAWSPLEPAAFVLGVGATHAGAPHQPASAGEFGAHVVTLEASLPGLGWRLLATAGYTVRDTTAPHVVVVAPVASAPPHADATLHVEALVTDVESGVVSVEAQVEGLASGAWQSLSRVGATDTWRADFDVSAVPEGWKSVAVRARDWAGNHAGTSATDANPVTVSPVGIDHSPPEIVMTWSPDPDGPEEGTCTNVVFELTFDFQDALAVDLSASQTVYQYDVDAPVSLDEGTPEEFSAEGTHLLTWTVSDHAAPPHVLGPLTLQWDFDETPPAASWVLEPEPPTLTDQPRNGYYYAVPVLATRDWDDAHGLVDEEVRVTRDGTVEPPVWLAPGTARLALVPGEEDAEFTIAARADDTCGNASDWFLASPPGSTETRFVIDQAPPDVEVVGVAPGLRYFKPVQPTFAATDNVGLDGPATATLWRDTNDDLVFAWPDSETPYDGTTLIGESDHYQLVVKAMDLAGNVTTVAIPFEVHVIERSLELDQVMPRVLVTQGDPAVTTAHAQAALTERGIDFDLATSTDQLIEQIRRGRANVVLLHRGSALGAPTQHPNWVSNWGLQLTAHVNVCPSTWFGLVDVGTQDITGRPLEKVLGGYRYVTGTATGTLSFLDSVVSPPVSFPFTGVGKYVVPTTSDLHARIGLIPTGLVQEITATHGRSVLYGTDYETDRRPDWKPIIANSILYAVPQQAPDLADNMVVAIRSTIVNRGPAITLRLSDIWPTVHPPPSTDNAKLEKALGSPVSTDPITWVLALPAWDGVSAPPAASLVYLQRLPDLVAPGAVSFESTLKVEGLAETVDSDVMTLDLLESRVSADLALDAELDALDVLLTNPADRGRLAAVRALLAARTGDPDANAADLKTIDLVQAYVELVQIATADHGPACRELTRLLQYWGWEYTARLP